ncbi:peroxisomal biogenesis factor [Mycena galopus ATCC 62051]|nr:peroxisomal biogenesis factor [Mycena galopus ATCC 62051]
MANLASQTVFHPVLSQTLKWFLISRGNKVDAARWNALKTHLALSARLLRLGKPAEHLQYALRAALIPTSGHNPAEKITGIARQVGYVVFLSVDNVLWAKALNLITIRQETYSKLAKLALKSWLAAIIFSIANAGIKTARLAREKRLLKVKKHDEKDLDRETKLRAIAVTRAEVRSQLIIDMLDLWNPATTLGFTHLNDGIIGALGFVFPFYFLSILNHSSVMSALMGLKKQWNAVRGKN